MAQFIIFVLMYINKNMLFDIIIYQKFGGIRRVSIFASVKR